MDMKKLAFSYLDPLVMDSRVFEQTQELRLAEGQPDVEKILGVWGQPVLRSKEWRGDTVGFSGGMLLFVLYRPAASPGCWRAGQPFRADGICLR